MKPPWDISQDCLLYTGGLAHGKSFALTHILRKVSAYRIPHKVFQDYPYLQEEILYDSEFFGGRGHYHHEIGRDAEGNITGHSLKECKKQKQFFTITNQEVIKRGYTRMFQDIYSTPLDNTLKLIECAGGTNILEKGHPASDADFSYETLITEYLMKGKNTDFRHRLRGVFHFEVEQEKSRELNVRRMSEGRENAIQKIFPTETIYSEYMVPTVMNLINGDDFWKVESLFRRVLNIQNDGISPSITDRIMDYVEYKMLLQFIVREATKMTSEGKSSGVLQISQEKFNNLGSRIVSSEGYLHVPDEYSNKSYFLLVSEGGRAGLVVPSAEDEQIDLSLRRRL